MPQLVYAFIARGTTVLCDYASVSGNYKTVALDCLKSVNEVESKFTIPADRHTFNFLNEGGYTFLVVADEAYSRSLCFAALDKIKAEYFAKYGDKVQFGAHSLDKAFSKTLKSSLEYVQAHPEEVSQVASVQKQVDDVKGIMVQNITKVLERGEKVEDLVVRTDDLRDQASQFELGSKQVRKRMRWQNMRMKVIILCGVLLLALIIFLLVCFTGGKNCINSASTAETSPPPPADGSGGSLLGSTPPTP